MTICMKYSMAMMLALAACGRIQAADETKSGSLGTAIVKGRVQAADDSTLKLRAIDGRKLIFEVGEDAQLKFTSRKVSSVSKLQKSDRVLVTYRPEGSRKVAVNIMESQVTPEEVVHEFQEAFQVTATYAYEQKQEYAEIVSGLLAEMDDLLGDMARQAEEDGEDVQKAYTRTKKTMMNRVEDVEQKLTRATKAGSKSWKELKAEVDESINELQRAYQEASEEFEQESGKNRDRTGTANESRPKPSETARP